MKEDAQVLIVQPDAQALQTQTKLLQEAGFDVTQTTRGQECLRLVRELQPNLILLAADLPDADSVRLCRQIKADRSLQEVFVVLLSTDGVDSDEASPADATVVGPVSDQDLLTRVRTFLRIQRTEKRLRASEARYRDIFEKAPIGIYRTTADGQILVANAALVDMLGYDSFEELAGRDLESNGYHPEYPRSEFKRRIDEKGEVRGMESAWRRKDRSILFVREHAQPVRDASGDIVGYQGTVEDITERVLRTRRLERLNAVLDAIRDVNQLIVRESDRQELISGVCRHLVETRGYHTAWVALLKDETIVQVGEAGLDGRVSALLHERDGGILAPCTDQALSQPGVWVGNPPPDCELADLYRAHKLMAVRLEHAGEVYGVMTVSLPRSIKVDQREKALLAEVAADIAFALHSIKLEEERERADMALRESERRQSLVLDATAEMFTYYNPNLEIQWANRAAADSVGLRREDLVGRHCYEVWGQSETPCDGCPVLKALETGEPHEAEQKTPDGRVWFLRGEPIFDEQGEIEGLVEFGQDITEQRAAAEALRESERRYRVLFESTGTATCVFGEDGVIQMCNERFEALAGLPKDVIEGEMAWSDFVAAEDLARMKRYHAQRNNETGSPPTEYEFTFVDAHGDARDIYLQLGMLEETGERVASLTDVTPLKLAEEALRESEERYRTLFESAPEAITLLDPQGTIVDCNPATETIAGLPREELIGEPFMDLGMMSPEDLPWYTEVFSRLLDGEQVAPLELKTERPDGQVRWLEAFPAPITERGDLQAIQVIARDVTERKEAEEALRRMQALLNQTQALARVGGWEYDVESQRVTWTDQMYHIYAVDPDAYDPNDIERDVAFYVPEDRVRMEEAFRAAVETGEPYDMELRFQNARGERLWVRTIGRAERRDGETVRVFGHLMDITDRKHAERALRENERFLRRIIDTSPNCIFVTDHDGRYVLVNQPLADLYDLPRERILSKTDRDLTELGKVSPEQAESCMAENQQVLATGARMIIPEAPFTRSDGTTRWFQIVKVPLSSKGMPGRVLGVAVDITEQRRTEKALRENEQFLRQVIDTSPNCIFVKDWDGRYVLVNQTIADLYDTSRQQMIGRTDRELAGLDRLSAEDAERFLADDRHVMTSGQPKIITEEPFTRSDGTTKWFQTVKVPLSSSGERRRILGVAVDITERKRARKALQESQRRLTTLMSNLPGMAYRCRNDAHRTMEFVSEGCRSLTGYDAEALSGSAQISYAELILPEDRQMVWDRIQDAVAERRPFELEYRIRTDDEQTRWVWEQGQAIFGGDGSVIGLEGFITDITERKRAEEALRSVTQQLQAFLDHTPALVTIFDEQGRYRLVNARVAEALGIAPEEAAGATLADSLPADLADAFRGRKDKVAKTREPMMVEDTVLLEGEERVFETVIFPLSPAKDGSATFGSIGTDVTQRKEMEEQLRQQERLAAIGQLAGGIAHDFNNILASIILYAQMGLADQAAPLPVERSLRTILQESHRAADLIQQILDFSRRAMIETEPVSLTSLVQKALTLLRRTIPENIHLQVQIGVDPCTVQGDPTRIHQALMNLALNAKDAMPDGGELGLAVERVTVGPDDERPVPDMAPGAWARLTVADTGTGMTEEVQDHLFEPFFTTKEEGQGTGLGLAQVYGIVKQHQGFIDVDTAPGEGATFSIFLPLVQDEEREAPVQETAPPTEGHGETILVVEDADRLRRAISEGLRSTGYHVVTAANGREGIEVLAAEDVDLVLTDVVMPQMGGEALLRNLRAENPNLKVIAMTGHVVDTDVQGLRASGFSDALPKPFSIEKLTEIVREVLDR